MTHTLTPITEIPGIVSEAALETALLLEGYGEQGTPSFIDKVKLIQGMDADERIKKVHMLQKEGRNTDLGSVVFLRERTICGILTDIHTGGRHNEIYLAVDGAIYKMDEWDLVIVKNLKNLIEAQESSDSSSAEE